MLVAVDMACVKTENVPTTNVDEESDMDAIIQARNRARQKAPLNNYSGKRS